MIERLRHYREGGIDETISTHDNMFQARRREHYFAVGRDAVAIIALAMIKAGIEGFANVLDLPCGSGRVMRHLVRFLPDASVLACDIDPNHVHFCAQRFGAVPLLSRHDLREVSFDRPIDLIWCGSLLTHLWAPRFEETLSHMVSWLSPGGLAIFTLHGRWSIRRQTNTPHKYTTDDTFFPVAEGVIRDGFGYVDYPNPADRPDHERYGLSVSFPRWVTRIIEGMEDVRLLDYTERGWDNHQDVLVLRKIPIAARPWLFEDAPAEAG
jgi:SAM-dependent methyltransferase